MIFLWRFEAEIGYVEPRNTKYSLIDFKAFKYNQYRKNLLTNYFKRFIGDLLCYQFYIQYIQSALQLVFLLSLILIDLLILKIDY